MTIEEVKRKREQIQKCVDAKLRGEIGFDQIEISQLLREFYHEVLIEIGNAIFYHDIDANNMRDLARAALGLD